MHGGRGTDIREASRLQRNRPSCTAVDRFGEAGLERDFRTKHLEDTETMH